MDSGEAEINITPKLTKNKEEIFTKVGDNFVKKLTYYINRVVPQAGIPVGDQSEAENRLFTDTHTTKDYIPESEDDDDYEVRL